MTKENQRSTLEKMNSVIRSYSTRITGFQFVTIMALLLGIVLAIALRYCLLDFKSLDYYASLKPWYNVIKDQGFSVFSTDFSTYNPPYLYLLYLIGRFFPGIPVIIAVKLPALISDFICAYFVYLIVRMRFENQLAPLSAGMMTLFAPTIVLNSAFWGQADSLFTAGILACLYFLMKKKHGWAFFSFGIALAFKLQAIFLAPLLFALFLKRMIPWKYFLIIPAVLLTALAPARIAGRPLVNLLNVYVYQTSQFEFLTMNAPSIYTWLPTSKQVFNLFYLPGIIAGFSAAFMFTLVVYKSRTQIAPAITLELALLILLIVPFFLPKMHERYFYPADIISIAFAFFYPQYFYIPILVGGASFLSYQSFLFETSPVPLPVLGLTMLITISIVMLHVMKVLYAQTETEDTNHPSSNAQKGEPIEAGNLLEQET